MVFPIRDTPPFQLSRQRKKQPSYTDPIPGRAAKMVAGVVYTCGDYVEGRWVNPLGVPMMIRGRVEFSDVPGDLDPKVWVGLDFCKVLATATTPAGEWKRADQGIRVWRTQMWRIPAPPRRRRP